MNDFKLLPDDPKLTAYALGELDAAEQAEVEAAVRADPGLEAAVAEIRALAGQLSTVLAQEPVSALAVQAVSARPVVKKKAGTLLKFPQLYFVIGGLAAACFAVVVSLKNEELEKREAMYKQRLFAEQAQRKTEVTAAAERARGEAMTELLALAGNDKASVDNSTAINTTPSSPPSGRLDYIDKGAIAGGRNETNAYQAYHASDLIDNGGNSSIAGVMADSFKTYGAPAPSAPPRVNNSVFDTPMSAKTAERIIGGWYKYNGLASSEFHREFSLNVRTRDITDSPKYAVSGSSEAYADQKENDFIEAEQNPLSTFSIDVDTASYANVRRFLNDGQRPPVDAVRIEELVNYFPYHYAPPVSGAENRAEGGAAPKDTVPFAASMEVASAPWAPEHRLVRIGLKGREVTTAQRGAANLVFLIDVSGSMNAPNRLPLVKESLRLLVGKLRADDHVALVVYAGASGLALPSTPVKQSAEILAAIDELTPGGSTNGAMGIQLAYDIAKANFVSDGINRVILCTDGDFNVGVTSQGDLTRLIEEKAKSKVFLTVLGFGRGNLKDETMEMLADKGNGNYGYVDSRREAEKLLVEQVNGTLVTIAKDVKLQVEFNPAQVASYRLIGYENRMLKKEDFNNDQIDAGEIGAGHTVTALYEIVPVGSTESDAAKVAAGGAVDALKYRKPDTENRVAKTEANPVSGSSDPVSRELLTLKVRYKEPTGDVSRKLEFALTDGGARFEQASADFQFVASVAEFGMILRASPHKGAGTLGQVAAWARGATADDAGGYRGEFISLVEKAAALQ